MSKVLIELAKQQDKAKSLQLARFFKTGKGEYGYGDVFWGITVPKIRRVVQRFYNDIELNEIVELLNNPVHEVRLTAVLLLVKKYQKGNTKECKQIFNIYLDNTKYINNWDLVDLSAPNIIGQHLLDKDRDILYKLAVSKSIWERRIAILATFTFIRRLDFIDCIKICEILLHDKQDLIHKACGWMLRETYKRSPKTTEVFLKKHYAEMPRVELRYAIEKMPETTRQYYLNLGKDK